MQLAADWVFWLVTECQVQKSFLTCKITVYLQLTILLFGNVLCTITFALQLPIFDILSILVV